MDGLPPRQDELCSCGRSLHYTDPAVRAEVERYIAQLGPAVKISLPSIGRTYIVPRHYIALHGLNAAVLPELGFAEVLMDSRPLQKQFIKNKLYVWTVYDHPSDYPFGFIARRFSVSKGGPQPTDDVVMSEEVEAIRDTLSLQGLYRLDRSPEDDPTIVESWL